MCDQISKNYKFNYDLFEILKAHIMSFLEGFAFKTAKDRIITYLDKYLIRIKRGFKWLNSHFS